MILAGKTIVVAGLGPGLGAEVARLALRDGACVVGGARNHDRLGQIAGQLDPTGERIATRAADVTDPGHTDALAQLAVDRFGRLDGVAVVAAYDAQLGGLAETPVEVWRDVLEINVVGVMNVIRSAVEVMDGGGSVVLVGTQSARYPTVRQVAYAASKGAQLSAVYHLVQEYGPRGVRFNTVAPSWMWGPNVELYVEFEAARREVPEADVVAELESQFPLGEVPADEDVAEAVVFLCSDRARMITGQTLYVNAGHFMP